MMCDRVRYQIDTTFVCRLLHDRCLTDSRRSDQKKRTLSLNRNHIFTGLILRQICMNCVHNLLFCLFDVHYCTPCFLLNPSCLSSRKTRFLKLHLIVSLVIFIRLALFQDTALPPSLALFSPHALRLHRRQTPSHSPSASSDIHRIHP